MNSLTLRLLLFVAGAAAAAVLDTHVEHERHEAENSPFTKRSRLQDMVLPMRIGYV